MFGLKMILETVKMFSPKLKEIGKSLEKVAEEAEKTKGQFTGSKSMGESGPHSGDSDSDSETRWRRQICWARHEGQEQGWMCIV
jgi:hypothetical protein